jgi:hypothetical protein
VEEMNENKLERQKMRYEQKQKNIRRQRKVFFITSLAEFSKSLILPDEFGVK